MLLPPIRPLGLPAFALLAILGSACTAPDIVEEQPPRLQGPYLGQAPPGDLPQLFAPGLVSTGLSERDFAMTPDGKEIYFTLIPGAAFTISAIVGMSERDGVWSGPKVAPFSGEYLDIEPVISADGQQFFFVSNRSLPGDDGETGDENIWVMDRGEEGWGEPRGIGEPINSDAAEFFPSVTRDGTIYFTRRAEDRTESIYRSRLVDGLHQEPEILGPEVNSGKTQFNAFIAPDESFIIVCVWGRDDSLGGVDYYVSFRSPEDVWTGPVNLGERINSAEGSEWSPYITPDGKYFIFMSSRPAIEGRHSPSRLDYEDLLDLHGAPRNGNADIWWVDAAFIESLRPSPDGN